MWSVMQRIGALTLHKLAIAPIPPPSALPFPRRLRPSDDGVVAVLPASCRFSCSSGTVADCPRTDPAGSFTMKMRQSISQFEVAFEQETALERRRREQLRRRAANRSRARRITRTEQKGTVRFSVLVACLVLTAVTVVVVMFETLAWLMA